MTLLDEYLACLSKEALPTNLDRLWWEPQSRVVVVAGVSGNGIARKGTRIDRASLA